MLSADCQRAIADAIRYRNAILKFISANDCGSTGGHQAGFYLPKPVWQLFTPQPPVRGRNSKFGVGITWPDGRKTDSVVTWYGATKDEYRLTRFGRDFHWLSEEMVGDLLVLVRTGSASFNAYILRTDDDVSEIQAQLGVEIGQSWAVFHPSAESDKALAGECMSRRFTEFAAGVSEFPSTADLSAAARGALEHCMKDFKGLKIDDMLVALMAAEYDLFRLVEAKVCLSEVSRVFRNVDEFLNTAASLMNRRKARAGRSLENHFASLLLGTNIRFDQRAHIDGTVEPDILIPGKAEYENPRYPAHKLCVLGLKTTCKDRWRQVLNEGRRVKTKHILTLQKGISVNQLNEMYASGIRLVVPTEFRKFYPPSSKMPILSVEDFVSSVRQLLA